MCYVQEFSLIILYNGLKNLDNILSYTWVQIMEVYI